MRVNQQGDEIREFLLFHGDMEPKDLEELLFMILDHLKLQAWRTNATKHGGWETQLRSEGGSDE